MWSDSLKTFVITYSNGSSNIMESDPLIFCLDFLFILKKKMTSGRRTLKKIYYLKDSDPFNLIVQVKE